MEAQLRCTKATGQCRGSMEIEVGKYMRESEGEEMSEAFRSKSELVCAQFEQVSARAMQKSVHQRTYPTVRILVLASEYFSVLHIR